LTTRFERVRDYYAHHDESSRLCTPEGQLERTRLLDQIGRHVPSGSRVLDLGGGPGTYTVELARQGYRVVLADLSPTLLEQARAVVAAANVIDHVESIDEVNALDLGRYPDGHFDAVLCAGPLYHLVDPEERSRAVAEVCRILRPGGRAFFVYLPRLVGLTGLVDRAVDRPDQVPPSTLAEATANGVFRSGATDGFQEGYYPTPDQMRALMHGCGLEAVDELSLRSAAFGRSEALAALTGPHRAALHQMIEDLCRDPAMVSTGGPALLICRRL